jgi:hypothetical protein
MYRKPTGGRWLEMLLFTLSSLFLYHTGVGIALFMVPLQVVASRRGIRGLLRVAGLFMAVFLGIRLFPLLRNPSALPDILEYVETGIVVLLLLGLIVVNMPLRGRPRTLAILAAAAAAVGAAAVPCGLLLSQNAAFQQSVAGLFVDISKTLSAIFAPADAVAGSMLAPLLQPEKLRKIAEAYLLRSIVADYLMLLAFSWWAGQAAASRTAAMYGMQPKFHFAHFRLEGGWLWPLIGAGALVLADLAFGLSFWAYAAWNIALGVLFIYGLQGLAILRFLFEKHGLPRLLWLLLIAAIVVLAASPRAGLFVMIALPVFGVSENWIRYRVPRGAAPAEKS